MFHIPSLDVCKQWHAQGGGGARDSAPLRSDTKVLKCPSVRYEKYRER